jgi:hypothetical protein
MPLDAKSGAGYRLAGWRAPRVLWLSGCICSAGTAAEMLVLDIHLSGAPDLLEPMGILDKAKEVTTSATAHATELRDHAAEAATSVTGRTAALLRDQTADLAADLRERSAALSVSVGEATIGRIKAAIADFNSALPIIALAGYTVSEVAVELGIPPKIIANFASGEAVPDDQVEGMLAQHADALLATTLVRALMNARKLQYAMTIGGLRPKGLAITIGISPSVVVKFG